MSSPSVMNPFPTMLVLQLEQMKQSLCQCLPSNEIKRVPPIPDSNERLLLTIDSPPASQQQELKQPASHFDTGHSTDLILNYSESLAQLCNYQDWINPEGFLLNYFVQ